MGFLTSPKMELHGSALRLFLGFVVLLVLLTPMSNARFVVEKNNLRVTSPEKIKGTHDSAIGNFGIPQYGGSMAGTVVYPKENQKGCKEFSDFEISFKSKPGALPSFVLVDRGGTLFLVFTNFACFLFNCFRWNFLLLFYFLEIPF